MHPTYKDPEAQHVPPINLHSSEKSKEKKKKAKSVPDFHKMSHDKNSGYDKKHKKNSTGCCNRGKRKNKKKIAYKKKRDEMAKRHEKRLKERRKALKKMEKLKRKQEEKSKKSKQPLKKDEEYEFNVVSHSCVSDDLETKSFGGKIFNIKGRPEEFGTEITEEDLKLMGLGKKKCTIL